VLIDGRLIYLKESRDKKAKGASAEPGQGLSRPFRPRRARPPGPFVQRPAFPQRRPMGSGPIGPLGPHSSGPPRPLPPRTNPPIDRFTTRATPPRPALRRPAADMSG